MDRKKDPIKELAKGSDRQNLVQYEDPYVDDIEEEEVVAVGEEEAAEELDTKQNETEILKKPWIPHLDGLKDGENLEYDSSAYHMYHALNVEWPYLSFDILPDNLGISRTTYPHTIYLVAGTQANKIRANKISVLKLSQLNMTVNDDRMDFEDSEDDDAGLDDDAVVEHRSIPYVGAVNRIKVQPQNRNIVASWSDQGIVNIHNLSDLIASVDGNRGLGARPKGELLKSFKGHGEEGYALSWSPHVEGTLISGSTNGKIYHWVNRGSEFHVDKHKSLFKGHKDSVEDLQWNPVEETVFASCSVDRSIKIWDVRVKNRRNVLSIDQAHDNDVNVISWNVLSPNLLASGSDDTTIKIWDLRMLRPVLEKNKEIDEQISKRKKERGSSRKKLRSKRGPGAQKDLVIVDEVIEELKKQKTKPESAYTFRWHTGPITGIEWNPNDEDMLIASGEDNQTTIWDIGLGEIDKEKLKDFDKKSKDELVTEKQDIDQQTLAAIPNELFFVHMGQEQVKEVHWHPQVPGLCVTTSSDGFNVFIPVNL